MGLTWRLAVVAHATIETANMRDFGRVYYAVQSWRHGGSLYAHTIATDEPQPHALRVGHVARGNALEQPVDRARQGRGIAGIERAGNGRRADGLHKRSI